MANNYYDATGVLVLDKVTPVISALFVGLNLDASYPGDGEVYISRISEGSDALWEDIADSLRSLAESLGVASSDNPDSGVAAVLERLAKHFGVETNEVLAKFIKHCEFADAADLESLFLIATCLEDGHGLKAVIMEAAWHSSKPGLFEFGGEGIFISREVVMYGSSGRVREFSYSLRDALLVGNLEEATVVLVNEVNRVLEGVREYADRELLRMRLARGLLGQ